MALVSDGSSWGIVTGSPGGKGRAVFLCGAGKTGDNYGLVTPTPTVNAMQSGFGGGIADGWYLVLDISKPTPEAVVPDVKKGERMTYERAARRVDTRPGKGEVTVPDGAVLEFSPSFPKWITADAEFRHPDPVNFWPNFFYGRPVSGSITWGEGKPTGSFVIKCDSLVQPRGEHDRRILGEIIDPAAPPAVTLTVKSLGPLKDASFDRKDSRGNVETRKVTYCEGDALLDIGGRTVNIRPQITFRPGKVVEKAIDKVTVSTWFSLKGSDLGMKGRAKDETFDVRIGAEAMSPPKK
jgi:hypothetical protein